MTDRKRDLLPEGYQFGDARHGDRIAIRFVRRWDITPDTKPFRLDYWNVIEGESHLLVEKCTEHGRERESDCVECRSLPRLVSTPFTADRDLGDEA